jgi:hypothetical protein
MKPYLSKIFKYDSPEGQLPQIILEFGDLYYLRFCAYRLEEFWIYQNILGV